MEKRKKWQFLLILAVLALTVYNILPTIFYYSKSLRTPIGEKKIENASIDIAKRVNQLEKESVDWLKSFCNSLKISPASIQLNKENPQQIFIKFIAEEQCTKFKDHFPRAGSLIPFTPAKLSLAHYTLDPKTACIQRQIAIHLEPKDVQEFFTAIEKRDRNGELTSSYKDIVLDRAASIAQIILNNNSENLISKTLLNSQSEKQDGDFIYLLSNKIYQFNEVFGNNSNIAKRFFANISKNTSLNKSTSFSSLLELFDQTKDSIKIERIALQKKEEDLKKEKKFLSESSLQQLRSLERKEKTITAAKDILKKNKGYFQLNDSSLPFDKIKERLTNSYNPGQSKQSFLIGDQNTFIKELIIDWESDKISLVLHDDILQLKEKYYSDSNTKYLRNQFDQLYINEIAAITRASDENIVVAENELTLNLNHLTNSKSLLRLDLHKLALKQSNAIVQSIQELWNPKHPELKKSSFPIVDSQEYSKLSLEEKSLCLASFVPTMQQDDTSNGMKKGSIYIVAKGLNRIIQKYSTYTENDKARLFIKDFYELRDLLAQFGFIGYPASLHYMGEEFADDYIFELDNYYSTFLAATRENFYVPGSKEFAVLEFTDLEQRILAQNKIDTQIHEDLLKWKDDYHAALASLDPNSKLSVPKPTKNPIWNNIALSIKKYFRGDERKVLRWGLDLSGGKTVSIELKDQNNKTVTNEEDLKQGLNELYNRVNKMGVSEVSMRLEGNHIMLDFPGSQNLSAQELVKASSMYFHVVNEKFSNRNSALSDAVDRFLQEVWNEAVVTNQKDTESVNQIARLHLYGDQYEANVIQPKTEAAKVLYDNGLRLQDLNDARATSQFDDAISKIGILRGSDYTKWFGQSHPLLIVFNNYALEGSSLSNIKSSYDPAKGNYLSFEVKSTTQTPDNQKVNPRSELYNWTSQFAKEKIEGTVSESYSNGQGWRMAVVLNDTIISAPTLDSPLKDSAMISGSFSQREANHLVSDLKAGSLTFTPKILSEKNVSPELGQKDRTQGIVATAVALILVIAAMTSYYRFAGIVASVAVLFNLIIMWATLQNLHATLSLAGIAGIILTVGMAVDANVLVFERIREEFSLTNRIAPAIQAGYKKAFSAILDSNVTTIIAGLILLNFDSGPIKGFAVTLIIGIASSMFTALFMTRFFFSIWVQNPKNTSLTMMSLIKGTHFNFLKVSKFVIAVSGLVILVGAFFASYQKNSLLGMDFTGGYAVNIEFKAQKDANYKDTLEKAFLENGATNQDFSVRTLTPSNHLRVMFGMSMEESGKPFSTLKTSEEKISWITNSIKASGLTITNKDLSQDWSNVSGQMSDNMKHAALISLAISLLAIMVYITIRFEWKYSVSALICLVHDVLVSLGLVAIFHALNFPIQIDLNTIAALMTIIGYSLNDTIIIFDRIREDVHLKKRTSLRDIVNEALNATLSRTLITSLTTFLVLLALVLLGGSTIFSFAFVMCIGVIFGTLSSLFIASPLMLFFHKLEDKKGRKLPLSNKA
ncbi:MAG: protein translocase subunit SecDF [Chlamydiae bacterium CG10_big_fil_rev_8_21_14_0_10_35_9]|nr:MAG: protein translocase subunit SecDF [Chlamydiae bacterium CG10_big_fil_rev_8_21_14_0_10_35_9]